jgi:Ca2+-binding EF-hand superfamily protein
MAFQQLGFIINRENIYDIISNLDQSGKGGIDYNDFYEALTNIWRPCDQDTIDDYRRVFNEFDHDSKGYITLQDFLRVSLETN